MSDDCAPIRTDSRLIQSSSGASGAQAFVFIDWRSNSHLLLLFFPSSAKTLVNKTRVDVDRLCRPCNDRRRRRCLQKTTQIQVQVDHQETALTPSDKQK